MPRHIYTPKVIADPVYGIVDIRPVLPMVETQEFQALADKRQLGMSYLVFPSATHTRMAHSLGAYHSTKELSKRWLSMGLIKEKEARALTAYALYHDIGHPAFSHVTEELCKKDNDGMSLEIIKKMRGVVEKSGVDFKTILDIASERNPLYLAVRDKNLGMDKLDYLERDGLYTILSRPAGIDYLRNHIYFINKQLMIDEKVVDNAIEVQNFYIKMYKNVYLRKASVIAQRMIQKAVYLLSLSKELNLNDLPRLTDSELIGIISRTKNKEAAALYRLLRKRDLFRETIVIRPQTFASTHSAPGKSVAVFGLDEKRMGRLIQAPGLQNRNQKSILELERRVAKIAGVPPDSVLIVSVFNIWRFVPKDILIYSEKHGTSSLKERYPAHFKGMEEVSKSYTTFRVCTLEKYRSKLSNPKTSKAVFEMLMELA